MLWTKEFGPVYLFRKVWEKLGLGRLLCKIMDDSEAASQYDEAVFAMVLNRLMDPNSKHDIFKQWIDTAAFFMNKASIFLSSHQMTC
ncbi:hypothetical protein A3Q35_09075 [Aeribacillus pallidus]|nr:hypothetical protein A3Q35_09075 [Aeribacillus pallidus]BBU39058.1 hypothetical protein APP_13500 [Aeribacillus pallidus]